MAAAGSSTVAGASCQPSHASAHSDPCSSGAAAFVFALDALGPPDSHRDVATVTTPART